MIRAHPPNGAERAFITLVRSKFVRKEKMVKSFFTHCRMTLHWFPLCYFFAFPAAKMKRGQLVCTTLDDSRTARVIRIALSIDEVDFVSFDYLTLGGLFW